MTFRSGELVHVEMDVPWDDHSASRDHAGFIQTTDPYGIPVSAALPTNARITRTGRPVVTGYGPCSACGQALDECTRFRREGQHPCCTRCRSGEVGHDVRFEPRHD